jgi:hypothetical protein
MAYNYPQKSWIASVQSIALAMIRFLPNKRVLKWGTSDVTGRNTDVKKRTGLGIKVNNPGINNRLKNVV